MAAMAGQDGYGGPLAGVRVLDLTRILSGPFCTMMLADHGADVVKIERPGTGDDTRAWGPPFAAGESAYFLSVNRNKRSATLDLGTDAGLESVRALAQAADVVVENFRPGTMDRLGLGYETLSRGHPELIYCSISGFGQDGPYRGRPGFDAVAQAMSGMMSLTGEPDGPPLKHGVPIADLSTAMWAAFAIVAALFERSRSGRGQYLDASLLSSQVSWLTYALTGYGVTGEAPGRYGNGHATIVPYQVFRCADGHIMVSAGNDKLFRALVHALGVEALAEDPRFATNPMRVVHRQELVPLLAERFARRPRDHWLDRLDAAGVPVSSILTVPEVVEDPHVRARGLVQTLDHPSVGAIATAAPAVVFSRTPPSRHRPPPRLGEHTAAVLAAVGWPAPSAPDREEGSDGTARV